MKKKEASKESTESRIREAARKLFISKGYVNTTARDIAAEAGINLALMNYYFRSKEKLFEIIMSETLQQFLKSMSEIVNADNSLEEKIKLFASNYIDMIRTEPDLPMFVLHELHFNPEGFIKTMKFTKILKGSKLISQIQEAVAQKLIKPVHPMQLMMSLAGMTIFPFLAKPVMQSIGDISNKGFQEMMEERKTIIPEILWNGILLNPTKK